MLSPSVQQDTHLLLAAYVVPPLVTYLTKYYLVLPLKKRAKVKKVLPVALGEDPILGAKGTRGREPLACIGRPDADLLQDARSAL